MMSYYIPEKDINQISSRWYMSQFVTKHKNLTPSRSLRKCKPFFEINFLDLLASLSCLSNIATK